MWILIILFKMYIAVILTVIVHESMHYFVATLIKVRVVNIAFGNSLHLFRIGKCLISPLIFSGYIEVDQEELYSKKKGCCHSFLYIRYYREYHLNNSCVETS